MNGRGLWLAVVAAALVLWQQLAAAPGGVPAPLELVPALTSIRVPDTDATLYALAVEPIAGLSASVSGAPDRRYLRYVFRKYADYIEADGKQERPAFMWCVQVIGGELLDDLKLGDGKRLADKYPEFHATVVKEFGSLVGDPKKDTLDAERRGKAIEFWRRVAESLR